MESVAAPWKVPVLNLVEITTTWGCILVVLTAGMHVREMSDDMLLFLMIFSMVALAMAGVSVLVTLGMTLWGLFRFAWRGTDEGFGRSGRKTHHVMPRHAGIGGDAFQDQSGRLHLGTYRIPLGLHRIPADQAVQELLEFQSSIELHRQRGPRVRTFRLRAAHE
eukprot:g6449.t1